MHLAFVINEHLTINAKKTLNLLIIYHFFWVGKFYSNLRVECEPQTTET